MKRLACILALVLLPGCIGGGSPTCSEMTIPVPSGGASFSYTGEGSLFSAQMPTAVAPANRRTEVVNLSAGAAYTWAISTEPTKFLVKDGQQHLAWKATSYWVRTPEAALPATHSWWSPAGQPIAEALIAMDRVDGRPVHALHFAVAGRPSMFFGPMFWGETLADGDFVRWDVDAEAPLPNQPGLTATRTVHLTHGGSRCVANVDIVMNEGADVEKHFQLRFEPGQAMPAEVQGKHVPVGPQFVAHLQTAIEGGGAPVVGRDFSTELPIVTAPFPTRFDAAKEATWRNAPRFDRHEPVYVQHVLADPPNMTAEIEDVWRFGFQDGATVASFDTYVERDLLGQTRWRTVPGPHLEPADRPIPIEELEVNYAATLFNRLYANDAEIVRCESKPPICTAGTHAGTGQRKWGPGAGSYFSGTVVDRLTKALLQDVSMDPAPLGDPVPLG